MAARDPRAFLDDIIDAIDLLRRLVAGRTLDDYRRDEPLRWAVERGLEIVSEASRHIPAGAKADHSTFLGARSPTSATGCGTAIAR